MKFYLYFLAFIAGFSTMAVELLASRTLSVVFGNSVYVWGGIIGVIMAAMAMGYYIGGVLADRRVDIKYLLLCPAVAGISVLLIPYISFDLMNYLDKLGFFAGIILSVVIIFSIPAICFAIVPPFIIGNHTKERAGGVAGAVYSVSTLGSILGVFLTTFYFIPFVGSKLTFFIVATTLLFLAGTGVLVMFKKKSVSLAASFFIITLLTATYFHSYSKKTIYQIMPYAYIAEQIDSAYSLLTVFSMGPMVVLAKGDGKNSHSMYAGGVANVGCYFSHFGIGAILSKGKTALSLGAGAGTSIAVLQKHFSFDRIVGVEIDPEIFSLAKKYFKLKADDKLELVVEDGRRYLRHSDEFFDLITLDMYTDTASVPFHLATKEFFVEVKKRLSRDGVMIMNVLRNGKNERFIKRLYSSAATSFNSLYIQHLSKKTGGGNSILIGFKEERSLKEIDRRFKKYLELKDIGFHAIVQSSLNEFEVMKVEPDDVYSDDLSSVNMDFAGHANFLY